MKAWNMRGELRLIWICGVLKSILRICDSTKMDSLSALEFCGLLLCSRSHSHAAV